MSVAKRQVSGPNRDWNYKVWMDSCVSAGVKMSLYEAVYDKILEIDLSVNMVSHLMPRTWSKSTKK